MLISVWNFFVRKFSLPFSIIDTEELSNTKDASTMYDCDNLSRVQTCNTDSSNNQSSIGYNSSIFDDCHLVLEPATTEPTIAFDLVDLRTEVFDNKNEYHVNRSETSRNISLDIFEDLIVPPVSHSSYTDCMNNVVYDTNELRFLHLSNESSNERFEVSDDIHCENIKKVLEHQGYQKNRNDDDEKCLQETLKRLEYEPGDVSLHQELKPTEEATKFILSNACKEISVTKVEESIKISEMSQGDKSLENGETLNDNFDSAEKIRYQSKGGEFISYAAKSHDDAEQRFSDEFRSLDGGEQWNSSKQKVLSEKEMQITRTEVHKDDCDKREVHLDGNLLNSNRKVPEGHHFVQHENCLLNEEFQNEYSGTMLRWVTEIINQPKGHSNNSYKYKDAKKLDCCNTASRVVKRNSSRIKKKPRKEKSGKPLETTCMQ